MIGLTASSKHQAHTPYEYSLRSSSPSYIHRQRGLQATRGTRADLNHLEIDSRQLRQGMSRKGFTRMGQETATDPCNTTKSRCVSVETTDRSNIDGATIKEDQAHSAVVQSTKTRNAHLIHFSQGIYTAGSRVGSDIAFVMLWSISVH